MTAYGKLRLRLAVEGAKLRMPVWLKWGGIGCLGLIALVVVLPFVGFLFAHSFWTFLLLLLVLLVLAGKVGGDEEGQETEEGQPSGFAATALGILAVVVLIFGVTATGKAISRAVTSEPETASEQVAVTTPEETTSEETTAEPSKQNTREEPEEEKKPEKEPEKEENNQQQQSEQAAQPEPEPEPAPQPQPEPPPESEPTPADTLAQFGTVVAVSRVVDGDTIEVSPAVDGVSDIRLIGVDTPEVYGGVEPFGRRASQFAKNRLSGQKVALEFDAERIDPYGRVLAYVYLPDGSMFNEVLVRQGYAQVATFPPNVSYTERFLAAQRQARQAGRGLWGLPPGQQCQLADRGNGIGGGCAAPAPEPAPRPAPQPQPAPQPAPSGTAPHPPPPDVDCSDFPALGNPQDWYFGDDPHRLDGDDDGQACEPY